MNPVIGSYGGGVDSRTLVAIDLNRDLVAELLDIERAYLDSVFPSPERWVFSDPGMEFQATYDHLDVIAEELGPRFVRTRRDGESLLEFCLRLGTLPLMPGSSHTCSLKWKGEVLQGWADKEYNGANITWIIGIEADESGRIKRFQKPRNNENTYLYPLAALGLTREDCVTLLEVLDIDVPHKSSCVGCPYMSVDEIRESWKNPEAWAIVTELEAAFQATSPRKHQAWLDAGKPLTKGKRPRAPRGMWRLDSWAEGARLFAKRIDGKQLSVAEWAAHFETEERMAEKLIHLVEVS